MASNRGCGGLCEICEGERASAPLRTEVDWWLVQIVLCKAALAILGALLTVVIAAAGNIAAALVTAFTLVGLLILL